ncbi:MAG: hypothetical protein V3S81_05645 [Anaerolineales bacterium]
MNARDRAAKILARDNRLKEIYNRDDRLLTASAVVEDARDPKSPLHSFFEWDDKKAAHQYRINQARDIIRNVRIQTDFTEHKISAPYYAHDPRQDPQEGGGYKAVDDLKSDKDHAREVLQRRLKSLHTEMETNKRLAEILGIEGDFESFIEHISQLRLLTEATN